MAKILITIVNGDVFKVHCDERNCEVEIINYDVEKRTNGKSVEEIDEQVKELTDTIYYHETY